MCVSTLKYQGGKEAWSNSNRKRRMQRNRDARSYRKASAGCELEKRSTKRNRIRERSRDGEESLKEAFQPLQRAPGSL